MPGNARAVNTDIRQLRHLTLMSKELTGKRS